MAAAFLPFSRLQNVKISGPFCLQKLLHLRHFTLKRCELQQLSSSLGFLAAFLAPGTNLGARETGGWGATLKHMFKTLLRTAPAPPNFGSFSLLAGIKADPRRSKGTAQYFCHIMPEYVCRICIHTCIYMYIHNIINILLFLILMIHVIDVSLFL